MKPVQKQDKKDLAIRVLHLLRKAVSGLPEPAVDLIVKDFGRDPFLILISCLLSLRAKDTVTVPIARILFARARTPQELVAMPLEDIEKIIFSIGFYRNKARTIKGVSKDLIDRFDGTVPRTYQELRSIKGIGQKTANLVLGYGFGIPALCVDTHVHQVANRLGLVATKTADQTEKALKLIVPRSSWIEVNRLFVIWGQQVCVPVSPFCSKCVLSPYCPKIGVKKRR